MTDPRIFGAPTTWFGRELFGEQLCYPEPTPEEVQALAIVNAGPIWDQPKKGQQ